jgi:hypothetical protein
MNAAFDEPLATLATREPALFLDCLTSTEAEAAIAGWRLRRARSPA